MRIKSIASVLQRRRQPQAFTMLELIVTVAVLGILGSVVFSSSQVFLRRDYANAAAAELVGWLDGWVVRWLVGWWLGQWLGGRLVGWMVGCLVGWLLVGWLLVGWLLDPTWKLICHI